MAKLASKLHVKKDGVTQECTCYTTAVEATPVAVQGGDCLEIKKDGIAAYLGLWPANTPSGSSFHTPLRCKKDNTEKIVETEVVSKKYLIYVDQNDPEIQELVVTDLSTSIQHTSNFEAVEGAELQVSINLKKEGYLAGDIWITYDRGKEEILAINRIIVCDQSLSFSIGKATLNTYLIEIKQNPHQTVTFKNLTTGISSTGTTTANHGDKYAITIQADEGYIPGEILNVPLTGTVTWHIFIDSTPTKTTTRSLTIASNQNDQNFCINAEGQKIGLQSDGYSNTVNLKYGAKYSIECTPPNSSETMFLKKHNASPLKIKLKFIPADAKLYSCFTLVNNMLVTDDGTPQSLILSSIPKTLALTTYGMQDECFELASVKQVCFAISVAKPYNGITSIACVDEKGAIVPVREIDDDRYMNYSVVTRNSEKEITMTINVE